MTPTQRAIAAYFDRPGYCEDRAAEPRSLHVTATVNELRELSDADLEARLAAADMS